MSTSNVNRFIEITCEFLGSPFRVMIDDLTPMDTISTLKSRLQKHIDGETGIFERPMVSDGHALRGGDDATLLECGLRDGGRIIFLCRFRGG